MRKANIWGRVLPVDQQEANPTSSVCVDCGHPHWDRLQHLFVRCGMCPCANVGRNEIEWAGDHAMNRHQLLACASAEMQTALKTYTHDDLPRTVTDTAAIDVLSALREGLRISTIQQLDALPDGCVVRDQRGLLWETDQGHMYAASYAMPMCIKTVALPAVIVWHPEWETR